MNTETKNAGDGPDERGVRPTAWTLQSELDAKETTFRAHLWFSNPVNSSWAPIYDQAALDAAVAAERERWRLKLTAHRDRTVMSCYASLRECEAARNALQRVLDDGA